jgi:hypothetical protein
MAKMQQIMQNPASAQNFLADPEMGELLQVLFQLWNA